MKRRHFLMLMVAVIIGLFSVAYAETVANNTKVEASESEISEAISEKISLTETPVPQAVPASPAAPKPIPPALPKTGELISWWDGGNQAMPIGEPITVIDVQTGKSFKAMRTYGHNHGDMETLTNADTLIMLEIWGGSWNWERRPVVVISKGRAIAASSTGMPHAGLDNAPAEAMVSGRSGGFGRGLNLDKIKNNGMDGHFDIHLLNSRTHGSNRVDARHQAAIRIAAGL